MLVAVDRNRNVRRSFVTRKFPFKTEGKREFWACSGFPLVGVKINCEEQDKENCIFSRYLKDIAFLHFLKIQFWPVQMDGFFGGKKFHFFFFSLSYLF